MNCQAVQTKIIESLAAGASELPDEMAGHRQHCPKCQAFYQAQSVLFAAVDFGMQQLVNQPVPGSLAPKVRALMESSVPQHSLRYAWLTGALAAALLCAVAIPRLRHHRGVPALLSRGDARTSARVVTPAQSPTRSMTAHAAALTDSTVHRRAVPRASVASEQTEVLMSRDEADGLSDLVQRIHQKPALGQAFLRPASMPPEDLKPLPLIEIAELRVPLLADESPHDK